ncbi:MAG TPA: hypothetical protein DD473_17285 [Planctomycetaceae bacterium]|nr:hypothetical protein [Planctomycetaceae bacterium]
MKLMASVSIVLTSCNGYRGNSMGNSSSIPQICCRTLLLIDTRECEIGTKPCSKTEIKDHWK